MRDNKTEPNACIHFRTTNFKRNCNLLINFLVEYKTFIIHGRMERLMINVSFVFSARRSIFFAFSAKKNIYMYFSVYKT